jgi:hypothetical protein
MQSSDLKIGTLYDVLGSRDCTYQGYQSIIDGGPVLHTFTMGDGHQALGVLPDDLHNTVREADRTDLHAFAAGVAAHNQAYRVTGMREWYDQLVRLREKPGKSFEDWAVVKLEGLRRLDFLLDNFPQGASFKLCGCECMSAGVEDGQVEYVTAGPHGLQELRLPFAMAAAVVLGAPI